jgi:hypothetical protein
MTFWRNVCDIGPLTEPSVLISEVYIDGGLQEPVRVFIGQKLPPQYDQRQTKTNRIQKKWEKGDDKDTTKRGYSCRSDVSY